jgi:hypothetical protein
MNTGCPDYEALLAADLAGSGPELEHAKTCAACSVLLEADREIARSLTRLRDPLPPVGFVAGVMARVEAQVASARKTRFQISAVFAMVVAGFAVAVAIAGPDTVLANAVNALRDGLALTTAARALIQTARPIVSAFSVPLIASQVLAAALLGLGIRRLVLAPAPELAR